MHHSIIDQRSLELHQRIAEKLRRNPALLDRARQNIVRWTSLPGYGIGTARAVKEWLPILKRPLAEVIRIITTSSPKGDRLRQSSPFAGILSEQERRRTFRKYASGST